MSEGLQKSTEASSLRCIMDSSVVISLHKGDILDLLTCLDWELMAPDLILDELAQPSGSDLEQSGIARGILTGQEMQKVYELASNHPEVSSPDFSVLVLAVREGTVLLTDDRNLRKVAADKGVEVHGTLWVMDRLVEQGVLTKELASHSLDMMVKKGRRFPPAEVARRLENWRSFQDVRDNNHDD